MQVLVNTTLSFEYHAGDNVPQCPFRGDVIIATDPGKSNMAMTIGTPTGEVLAILQFRAPGYSNNNSTYCHDFKEFLTAYLKDCRVTVFAIEAAISKEGMNFHRSSMVLTEIRANLIDLSYRLTGSQAKEVNNWAWKHAILPDGYRSQSEKGSARFLKDLFVKYGNADVTDSVCIYKYAVSKWGNPYYAIIPDAVEEPLRKFKPRIAPVDSIVTTGAVRFSYNPELSLMDNLTYAMNRTTGRVAARVSTDILTLEDIYKYARLFKGNEQTTQVEVVGLRL